jgi:hypothetical protein
MILSEVAKVPALAYVPTSTRERFDDIMTYIDDDAEEFESREEFLEQYPDAINTVLIYTNPKEDYRGQSLTYAVLPANLEDPEFAVWRVPSTGFIYIEDLLNDPSMVTQMYEIQFKRLSKLIIPARNIDQVVSLINTDD